MTGPVGPHNLGEFARSQLDHAGRDPRLARERGAMVADFWDAIEEAERTRLLGIWGLYELTQALEHEERRLGVSRNDPDLDGGTVPVLQAAWERAELARRELANGHPHLNAQALISMNSALDALVEEWVPSMRAIRIKWTTDLIYDLVAKRDPDIARRLSEEEREAMLDTMRSYADQELVPKVKPLRGKGPERFERTLAQEGLAAPDDRPIPVDLARALTELGALRDIFMHRAGRIDKQALEAAPSLPYVDGELVRISTEEYRKYSAAVRCYAAEILFRSMRNWPEASDEEHGPDLSNWRGYYRLGA